MRNETLRAQCGARWDQLRIAAALTTVEWATQAKLTPDYVRRLLGGEQEARISTVLALGRALGLEVRRTKRDANTGKVLEPQCLCAMFESKEPLPLAIRAGLGSLALDRMHALDAKEERR